MSETAFSFRRLWALSRKETWQILRDPSSNIIAFILPVVMLFIYGYGINLDSNVVDLGLVLEDTSPDARDFADSLYGSRYFKVIPQENIAKAEHELTLGHVRGFVIVPVDFAERLQGGDTAPLFVVADGSEPNIANFVTAYVNGAWTIWLEQHALDTGGAVPPGVNIEPRFWFNPSVESRNYLIPGSITIIMTVIGALLSSLVIAREWERGTMEVLLASPVTRTELLLSKLIPYYILGIISLFLCVAVGVFIMGVPFHGSLFILWVMGSLFLISSLGLGLLLSTTMRNQFNAAQAALQSAFLPAVFLSGFIYEIQSMPKPIQAITYLIPARYFVTAMQTLFQAGNVWPLLIESGLFLLAAGILFISLTFLKTPRRLD